MIGHDTIEYASVTDVGVRRGHNQDAHATLLASDEEQWQVRGHIFLVADGYETLQVQQNIEPPWYEYVGLDFISENLIPWTIRDRRVFQYHLEPRRLPNPKELLDQAQNLRNRGISLGGGSAQPVAPSAPTTVPVPAVPPGVGPPPP